jgi:hypothetical protein
LRSGVPAPPPRPDGTTAGRVEVRRCEMRFGRCERATLPVRGRRQ